MKLIHFLWIKVMRCSVEDTKRLRERNTIEYLK
jgi:hypothetical protein